MLKVITRMYKYQQFFIQRLFFKAKVYQQIAWFHKRHTAFKNPVTLS